MAGLTATLGARPSQDPNPGSKHSCQPARTTYFTQQISGCQQETLLIEPVACAGNSRPNCCRTDRVLTCELNRPTLLTNNTDQPPGSGAEPPGQCHLGSR